MPFDPTNPEYLGRLGAAVESAISGLSKYRKNYNRIREKLHDPCHVDRPTVTARLPVNPMHEFSSTLTRMVVSRHPTLRIDRSDAPRIAGMYRSRIEKWGVRSDMAEILRGVFQESLLRWGRAYVSATAGRQGFNPQVEVLDFEDWFIDHDGKADEREVDFEGHEYEKTREELDGPEYDAEAVRSLNVSNDGGKPRLYDLIRLRCTWLPRERLLLTTAANSGGTLRPIKVQKYTGPDEGPYIGLAIEKQRGKMMPYSILAGIEDLHDLVTVLKKQEFQQADSFREILIAEKSAAQDADVIRTAEHGKVYTVNNINATTKMTLGGVAQATMLGAMQAEAKFNEVTGNLNLVSGRGASAPTLGQERQLGMGVADMISNARAQLNDFASRLYGRIGWYFRHDDFMDAQSIEYAGQDGKKVTGLWEPGMGAALSDEDPEMRIVADSMIERTGAEQSAALLDSIMRMASLMVLPGKKPSYFDLAYLGELMADYENKPELTRLFGQAASANALAAGAEGAAAFAQGGGGAAQPGRTGPSAQDRMRDKLMFNAPSAPANPNPVGVG